MSNENIVYSHELTVRLDQMEDGTVNWLVQPDTAVENTSHASLDELAVAGAPLSALGIRVLWEMLGENLIFLALERANGHLWKRAFNELQQHLADDPFAVEGELAGDAEEPVVVH